MSLVGDFAAGVLRTTSIGKGFFGARGISAERGLMDLNPDEVRLKREMVSACECVIGVFDHTKWRRTALLSFVPTPQINAIVTDSGAPAELVQEWRERNVNVVTADFGETASSKPVSGVRRGRRASDRKGVTDTIGRE
jgi:DeoR/GlpR family transcriptional regulator of sugar metabolism